jgi:hypothetical protein
MEPWSLSKAMAAITVWHRRKKATPVLRPKVVNGEKGFFAKKEQIDHRRAVTFRWRSGDIDESLISAHRGWLGLCEERLTMN